MFVSTGANVHVSELFRCVVDYGSDTGHEVEANVLGRLLTRTAAEIRPPSSGNGQLGVFCVARTSMGPPAFIFFYGGTRLFRFSCRHCLRGEVHRTFTLRNAPVGVIMEREKRGW